MENLNKLVDRLSEVFLPAAVQNQSFFLNDVPADLAITSNTQYISSVLSRMISTVVKHVSDTCIRFTARRHGNIVVLEVQESGSVHGFAMASELQQVNSLAERFGGRLSITLPRPETTAISFSFPDDDN